MKLILIGAGHSHLYVASKADAFRRKGIDVTLVTPGFFWYSGLATGVLGGEYEPEEDQVDPQRLIEHYGGTFIKDRMVDIMPEEKRVILDSGKSLEYDALSLNIGSEVPKLPGERENVWHVKPISNLWHLRKEIEKYEAPHIVVVGGGPTGCEVAANIANLSKHCRLTLIAKSDRLMPGNSMRISDLMEHILKKKGVKILKSTEVKSIEDLSADIIVVATGLVAPKILGEEGLHVDEFLQSVKYPAIFGAGDCINLADTKLPKLGVFGVREAPILYRNLLAYLQGKPMEVYKPQKNYLSILNFGDGTALAIREPFYWHGRLSFWLKDYLDRSFLNMYRV